MSDSSRAIIDKLIHRRILEKLYQGYEIKNKGGHYEIWRSNQFVSSADTESEAQCDIDEYLEAEEHSQKIMKEADELSAEEDEESSGYLDFSDKDFLEATLVDSIGSLRLIRKGRTVSGVQANIEANSSQLEKVHDAIVKEFVVAGAAVEEEKIFLNDGAAHKRLKGARFRVTKISFGKESCTVRSRSGGMEENMIAISTAGIPPMPGWELQSE